MNGRFWRYYMPAQSREGSTQLGLDLGKKICSKAAAILITKGALSDQLGYAWPPYSSARRQVCAW